MTSFSSKVSPYSLRLHNASRKVGQLIKVIIIGVVKDRLILILHIYSQKDSYVKRRIITSAYTFATLPLLKVVEITFGYIFAIFSIK